MPVVRVRTRTARRNSVAEFAGQSRSRVPPQGYGGLGAAK